MKKSFNFGWLIVTLLFFVGIQACSTALDSDYEEIDLMRHGLPIKVMGPPDAEVKASTTMGQRDIQIDGGEDFFIQVLQGEFNSGSRDNLLNEQKSFVTANRFFHRFVLEEGDGFIYEFKIDSLNSNYGFRRIHIQGDSEYIFRNGMGKIFNEEQALNMFNAVKQ